MNNHEDHAFLRGTEPDWRCPDCASDPRPAPKPEVMKVCHTEMHPSGRRVWVHRPGCKYGAQPW